MCKSAKSASRAPRPRNAVRVVNFYSAEYPTGAEATTTPVAAGARAAALAPTPPSQRRARLTPHAAAARTVAIAAGMHARNRAGCSAGHRPSPSPATTAAPRLADRRVELQRQRAARPYFHLPGPSRPRQRLCLPPFAVASSWHVAGCARGASSSSPGQVSAPRVEAARQWMVGSLQVRRPSRLAESRADRLNQDRPTTT